MHGVVVGCRVFGLPAVPGGAAGGWRCHPRSGRFAQSALVGQRPGQTRGSAGDYLLLLQPGLIYLFQVYTKGDIADLLPEQKKRLRGVVEEIKKHHAK
jgi:hypothetical protein